MNAEAPVSPQDMHWLKRGRLTFRQWRGTRPYWAGLFTLLGGVPILYFPYADVRLGNVTIAMATTAGSGSLIIGFLLITLGLCLWFQQTMRVFAGVAAILLALISLPVSNFGGFFLGFFPALIGGALALSWAPGKAKDEAEDGEDTMAEIGEQPEHVPGPRTETDPQGFPYEQQHADHAAYEQPYEQGPAATETTAHANGGRNSAG
ncbi:DUF6114 domain-containing protein [Streptomyces sp. NPDC093225]|uniref:DUF6114 domain-containing protein n=1 Tax=Streptomyces sp. NPDC093225 TaxID=3366034 RepID=UPI003819D9C5